MSVCLEELSQSGLLIWQKVLRKTLKNTARNFQFFPLACDKRTHITNTAELAIYVRGIIAEFDTWEGMLSLQALHGTTKVKDLSEQVVLAMNKFELPF